MDRIDLEPNYLFRIQPVPVGAAHWFQLRVGMPGESAVEFIPVHRSAFAQRLFLEPAHAALPDAHFELTSLLEWLNERPMPAVRLDPASARDS
jgi:hypothetical protein